MKRTRMMAILAVASLFMFVACGDDTNNNTLPDLGGTTGDSANPQTDSEPVKASCNDKVLNQDETDVDCGGTTCYPCTEDKKCKFWGDCESGLNCQSGLCQVCKPINMVIEDKVWSCTLKTQPLTYKCKFVFDGKTCYHDCQKIPGNAEVFSCAEVIVPTTSSSDEFTCRTAGNDEFICRQ